MLNYYVHADMTLTPINISTEQCFIECQYKNLMYMSKSLPSAVSVAVLSSAVLSIIGTTLITSLVWCCAVIKMRKKRDVDINPHTVPTQHETMMTPLQGNISLEENVAYGQVGSRIRK